MVFFLHDVGIVKREARPKQVFPEEGLSVHLKLGFIETTFVAMFWRKRKAKI